MTIFGKSTISAHQLKSIFCLYKLERYIHALSRNTTKLLNHRWQSLFLQTAFYRCCETTRVHFMVLGRRGVNRTARGTRLLLTAVLASLVDCISSCHDHLLKAQHCSLGPNWCFIPPSAPHPPPPSTPPSLPPSLPPTHLSHPPLSLTHPL